MIQIPRARGIVRRIGRQAVAVGGIAVGRDQHRRRAVARLDEQAFGRGAEDGDRSHAVGGAAHVLEVAVHREAIGRRPLGVERIVARHRIAGFEAGIGVGRHVDERAAAEIAILVIGERLGEVGRDRTIAGEGEIAVVAVAELIVRADIFAGELQRIGRLPLQGDVDAETAAVAEIFADADAVRQIGRRTGAAQPCRRGDIHGVHERAIRLPALIQQKEGLAGDLVLAEGGLLEGDVDEHADLADAGIPAIRNEQVRLRLAGAEEIVIIHPARCGELEAVKIERLARAQVDEAADAALDQFGRRVLVDIDAGEQFGGDILKAERATAVRGEDVAAVDLRPHLAEAADRDGAALAEAALDLHAGDPLQRLCDVPVRQLADIFRDDRIDDLVGIPLDALRAGQAGANAGDDDVLFGNAAARQRIGHALIPARRNGRTLRRRIRHRRAARLRHCGRRHGNQQGRGRHPGDESKAAGTMRGGRYVHDVPLLVEPLTGALAGL